MRTHRCIVSGCIAHNKENTQFNFFCLPRNPTFLSMWVKNLNLGEIISAHADVSNLRVCGRHFEDSCFQNHLKQKLNRNAVPTNFNDEGKEQPSNFHLRKLSSRKKKMHGELVKARRIIAIVKKLGRNSLKNLFPDMDFKSNKYLKEIEKIDALPPAMQIFLFSTVRNYSKKPAARRYSSQEKSFYVALYKSSPREYHHLFKVLPMPSPNNLNKFLTRIPLKPGINNKLFSQLNLNSEKLNLEDRYCVLLFDAVPLRPHLSYSRAYDKVGGLETIKELADCVIIFMIRGLNKLWKQLVAFYFIQSTVHSLKSCITEVIRAIHERTKFIVLASVSDTGINNWSAVLSLSENCSGQYIYNTNGHEIIHIFDAPHLMRCMRNNFMIKDIVFDDNKIAKWDDLRTLNEFESITEDSRLTKLSKDHLQPEGRQKMKVNLAVQVFSRIIYAILTTIPNIQKSNGTADLCLFMNNLFDSLNTTMTASRPLAARVTIKSDHHEFWEKAKIILNEMSFTINGSPVPTPPCIHFFKITINNIQALWTTLRKLGFKYLLTKSVNQDPLENLFAVIRGLCGQNNPTRSQFISAFKTCLINKTLKNSKDSNCEDDGGYFLTTISPVFPAPSILAAQTSNDDVYNVYKLANKMKLNSTAYVAKFIGQKLLQHDCHICVNFYTTNICADSQTVIRLDKGRRNNLLLIYPRKIVLVEIGKLQKNIFGNLPKYINKNKIIENIFLDHVSLWTLENTCPLHNEIFRRNIVLIISHVMLKYFISITNKKLSKKYSRPNAVVDNYLNMFGLLL